MGSVVICLLQPPAPSLPLSAHQPRVGQVMKDNGAGSPEQRGRRITCAEEQREPLVNDRDASILQSDPPGSGGAHGLLARVCPVPPNWGGCDLLVISPGPASPDPGCPGGVPVGV